LAPLKGRRFIVFHDAYQYLEKRYQLAAAGSILVSADRPPSAQRLNDIRTKIRRGNVACVFAEPQHPDDLVKTVVEGTTVRTGKLDPDGGADVPEGKEAYFTMMRNLGQALAGCLGATG
jgi:zinc transport system substrate-binding protein